MLSAGFYCILVHGVGMCFVKALGIRLIFSRSSLKTYYAWSTTVFSLGLNYPPPKRHLAEDCTSVSREHFGWWKQTLSIPKSSPPGLPELLELFLPVLCLENCFQIVRWNNYGACFAFLSLLSGKFALCWLFSMSQQITILYNFSSFLVI